MNRFISWIKIILKKIYGPKKIKKDRNLWEARKADIDLRRPGWKKQKDEIDEILKRIKSDEDI